MTIAASQIILVEGDSGFEAVYIRCMAHNVRYIHDGRSGRGLTPDPSGHHCALMFRVPAGMTPIHDTLHRGMTERHNTYDVPLLRKAKKDWEGKALYDKTKPISFYYSIIFLNSSAVYNLRRFVVS